MKSITSKLSIIILSLAAMAFTFVLGSTSSKALSDETAFAQCVAEIILGDFTPQDLGETYGSLAAQANSQAVLSIIQCARS
jgi:hypothetical protein